MSDCVLWEGTITRSGYGAKKIAGRVYTAHRLAWEAEKGPIPEGYELHHVCGNRACVNLAHLELLTRLEHRRKHLGPRATGHPQTHCKHGHAFDEANTYVWRGVRHCRKCRAAADQRRLDKRAGEE